MNEDKLKKEVIMNYFADGLNEYIREYFASINGIIYKPQVDYIIPNPDAISEHAREIQMELMSLVSVNECSPELKEVAKQYLPVFLKEYPEFEKEECLKIN